MGCTAAITKMLDLVVPTEKQQMVTENPEGIDVIGSASGTFAPLRHYLISPAPRHPDDEIAHRRHSGLGPIRENRLMKDLGGIAAIETAGVDTLKALPRLPDAVDQAVHDKIHARGASC